MGYVSIGERHVVDNLDLVVTTPATSRFALSDQMNRWFTGCGGLEMFL